MLTSFVMDAYQLLLSGQFAKSSAHGVIPHHVSGHAAKTEPHGLCLLDECWHVHTQSMHPQRAFSISAPEHASRTWKGGSTAPLIMCPCSHSNDSPAMSRLKEDVCVCSTGWLSHWGEVMANTSAPFMLKTLSDILGYANGTGSVNFYMAHGGSNFGYWAGWQPRHHSQCHAAVHRSTKI